MKTTRRRLHLSWLLLALLLLAALSTMTALGVPAPQATPPTPATEEDAATTPTAAHTTTAPPPATAVAATPTPVEKAETTDDATPTATTAPLSEEELISQGAAIYARYCAACHQLDGEGIANAYPALAGNPFVTAEDPAGVLRVVFTGRAGMPHFRDYLSEEEIAAAVSYIRNGWENNAAVVTLAEVQSVRTELYSPSEAMDHNGASGKDGSNGAEGASQEGDRQTEEQGEANQ